MRTFTIGVLRVLHVVAGGFWLGVAIMNAFLLLPAIRAAGPAGGQVMALVVQKRRLPRYVNTAIVLTVVTGLVLYSWRSGGFGSWILSPSGLVFGKGAIVAIVAAGIGVAFITPTASRIGALAASAANSTGDELVTLRSTIQQLQARMQKAAQVAAILLVLAAACMAAGRYV